MSHKEFDRQAQELSFALGTSARVSDSVPQLVVTGVSDVALEGFSDMRSIRQCTISCLFAIGILITTPSIPQTVMCDEDACYTTWNSGGYFCFECAAQWCQVGTLPWVNRATVCTDIVFIVGGGQMCTLTPMGICP